MEIASLILPVFAVILTGWLAGALGLLPRELSAPLVRFTYTVAMPALVFLTIARAPLADLLDARFLAAFGGGTMLCFALVGLAAGLSCQRGLAGGAMAGAAASMTNTGFVALPILQALFGARGVLPAAVATLFLAVVQFPALVLLLEAGRSDRERARPAALARQVALNPVMLSTLSGLLWSIAGPALPAPVEAWLGILADALTPCALFAIGLGLSFEGLRGSLGAAAALTALKLLVTPLAVFGLCLALGLDRFQTLAAVVCAAVPTAKTAYVLAGAYRVEQATTAATFSLSTLLSALSLLGWLAALA